MRVLLDECVDVDRNLAFQQNVNAHAIAVIVLRAPTNRLADLNPLVPMLIERIEAAQPHTVTFVESPVRD